MEKQLCIVLRAVNYKDNDRILTLLSQEQGRLTASARGVRRLKSGLATAAQPFCCAEYEFFEKGGRLYIRAAAVKEAFYRLQNEYDRYAAGCVMLELTEKMAEHTRDTKKLFLSLVNTLYAMEQGKNGSADSLAYFLVRSADLLGIFPALDFCAVCGASVGAIQYWSAREGGAVCAACAERAGAEEADETLSYFSFFRGGVGKGRPARDVAAFFKIAGEYLRDAGDIRLKTLKYMERIDPANRT